MNESPGFTLTGLGKARSLRLEDYETFLELIPDASLLVDENNGQVLLASARLTELTAYTRNELTGLPIQTLLPEWYSDSAPLPAASEPPATQPQPLLRRNKSRLTVQVLKQLINPQRRLVLVVLATGDTESWLLKPHRAQESWENLSSLTAALQTEGFEPALDALLAATHRLTGAGCLAIYRLRENKPVLQRCALLEDEKLTDGRLPVIAAEILPDTLQASDLVHLNGPKVWVSGRRPTCALHRLARASGLAYLASAPVGHSRAITGLVVFGSSQPGRVEFLEGAVKLVASLATALFQQSTRAAGIEDQLNQRALQLQVKETLEENAREGILSLDPHLHIRRINQSAELMLGYAGQEVAGHPVEKILIGPEGLLPALTAAQAGSPTHNLGSVRLYRRSGDAFLALVRIFPVLYGEQVAEIIIFIEDLSEQEQNRLQTQQLEHRALLGEVTAVFAHEVRNPINNISTGLQLMAMNLPQDDPAQENISRMMQDCDRLAELIKSVLAFSRPTEYEMEPLDLGRLLQRLLDRLRPRITRLNVQYDLKVEPDLPPIQANLRALEQVFGNLITNALQAMGEAGGHLILKAQTVCEDDREYAEVSVADTGPGIPREVQEKIFQPFFTTERSGTGLGLAICKRILTAHKGTIRLESFPGGTIFYVRFPV